MLTKTLPVIGGHSHGQVFKEVHFFQSLYQALDLGVDKPDLSIVEGVVSHRHAGLGSIVDIVPTLLGTMQLSLDNLDEAQFEGHNLLDSDFQRDFLFAQRSSRSQKRKKIQQFALQDAEWKFIISTDGREQFFHLRRDPAEYFDVINQYPDEAARLKNQLRSMLAKYLREERGLQVLEETSEKTLNELRSLGYLD